MEIIVTMLKLFLMQFCSHPNFVMILGLYLESSNYLYILKSLYLGLVRVNDLMNLIIMLLPQIHVESILRGRHSQPHEVLGMHVAKLGKKIGLRAGAFLQGAKACELVESGKKTPKSFPMQKLSEEGYFEVFIPRRTKLFKYFFRITDASDRINQRFDPYSFWPTLSDEDLYLFNEGTHHRIYEKLGTHVREIDGMAGVAFAVWAPNAVRVSVVSDFNYWDGRYYPMRSLGVSGVWELFIPELKPGFKYKYEIIDRTGNLHIKSDPYAIYYQEAPNCASIAYEIDDHKWQDEKWIQNRASTDWKSQPLSIYEVHLGSWRQVVADGGRSLTYREAAFELAQYVKQMGFTHIEFMPLAEHPFTGSWGYQVTGFYAPTSQYGTPEDFMFLIDTLHQNGIGVIMDWVPAHFPKDSFALANFDGTALYEHADPRQGEHPDWGTLIFNYGRKEVVNFLVGSALFWIERFHIDGLRVDAVASMLYLDYSRKEGEWIPNKYGGRENIEALEFLRYFNDLVHQYFPGILTIAEESTAFPGLTKPTSENGLGFDYKWNMGWMHDNLSYFSKDPIHRKYHHNQLTFGMLYQYSENFMSVFSHDEVVHGKASMIMKMGAPSMTEKAQTLRALYAYMWLWPGKKTLFMGSEFGQSLEWQHDRGLDWHLLEYQDHQGIQDIVRDLNAFYRGHPSLSLRDGSPAGFQWVNADAAEDSIISFLRIGENPEETFLVVGNFTPVLRDNYRIGVDYEGHWREVINSNASKYGGTGTGNSMPIYADSIACNGRQYSVNLMLPGLSLLVFQYIGLQ